MITMPRSLARSLPYVLAGLGLAAVGVGAVLVVRWARARSASAPLVPAPEGENQGEGNRTASRAYNDGVRDFIDDGRVDPAARDAAIAVSGPEGASLRAAEAKGRTSPTNGH